MAFTNRQVILMHWRVDREAQNNREQTGSFYIYQVYSSMLGRPFKGNDIVLILAVTNTMWF